VRSGAGSREVGHLLAELLHSAVPFRQLYHRGDDEHFCQNQLGYQHRVYCAPVKTRLSLLVALLVASAVLGTGCSLGDPEATKTIEVPMDDVLNGSDINRDVTLAVGNTLKVVLGSNDTTPYRWGANAKIGDPGVVKQTSHEFVKPDNSRNGAPGTEVWIFTALKTGTTTIATTYATIVGGDNTPTCTFTAKVTVQ
jgi:inhibitor of cysteine peptidase